MSVLAGLDAEKKLKNCLQDRARARMSFRENEPAFARLAQLVKLAIMFNHDFAAACEEIGRLERLTFLPERDGRRGGHTACKPQCSAGLLFHLT